VTDDLPPWMTRAVRLTSAAVVLYGFWATVICFTGGNFPLTSWHIDGGLLPGTLMLFIGEPLLFAVGRWTSLVVFTAVAAIAMTVKQIRQRS
jgi:hypothetical protein